MTDWSETVRQHGPAVWRTASRLLGNDADASDCFQETFVSAVRLSRQQTIRCWPATLKRIATARALESLRKRYQDKKRNEREVHLEDVDISAPDPSQGALNREFANDVRKALMMIDEQQAEVFCLIAFEEFSYREAARQLNLSVSHVGVLLHRAKIELRGILPAHTPHQTDAVPIGENNER